MLLDDGYDYYEEVPPVVVVPLPPCDEVLVSLDVGVAPPIGVPGPPCVPVVAVPVDGDDEEDAY